MAFLICACLIGCRGPEKSKSEGPEMPIDDSDLPFVRDLNAIKERGYLTAIVDNSATSMFLYRGEPMGYEYELISNYAAAMGLDLKFKITKSLEDGFSLLNAGHGDILAHNLTITKERRESMGFTDAHYEVRQVLVQRKPDNWRKMKLHEIDQSLIRNPIGLIGKEIYVRQSSAYVSRLKNLSDEIGGEILIIEESDLETETIIDMVADGTLDYTVADENIAKMMARFDPILDVQTAISFPQQIAWGVRSNSDSLRVSINQWLAEMKGGAAYNDLYNKYYRNSAKVKKIVESDHFSKSGHKISPYDSLIKEGAQVVGWDWRLLAAQISRESRFDPKAKSWVGAVGLMQVMPKTAQSYGIKKLKDPAENIKAGTQHILWVQNRWPSIADSSERVKYVLASYNVGHGHVQDAVRLAEKFEGQNLKWEIVAKYLKLKSQRRYYEDPVVQYGYCRGNEPVEYVEDILSRYEHYIQMDTVFVQ